MKQGGRGGLGRRDKRRRRRTCRDELDSKRESEKKYLVVHNNNYCFTLRALLIIYL